MVTCQGYIILDKIQRFVKSYLLHVICSLFLTCFIPLVKDDETGQLADQLKAKEAELKALSDRLQEQLKEKEAELLQLSDRHQELLKAKEAELLDVSCERDQLVGSLEELDAQQQIAMAKVIQVRYIFIFISNLLN